MIDTIKSTLSSRAALRLTAAACLTFAGTLSLATSPAQAQTKGVITTLHTFTGTGDTPSTKGQIKASDGNFYGCSNDGGIKNSGFIYKLTPAGAYSVLHTFQNDGSVENDPLEGTNPRELIQAADGNLYGICRGGGAEINTSGVGTVWKLTLSGTFTKLYDFDNGVAKAGAFPSALVQGKDGNFYGLTRDGGANFGDGTYFRLVTNGTKAGTTRTELFSFHSGNGPGTGPDAQLLVLSDGTFYGVTQNGGVTGGASASGTIFKATTSGSVTKIYAFVGDTQSIGHSYPLIQGRDGMLYGASNSGGDNGFGTLFRCTLDGTFTLLHDFVDPFVDGSAPYCALVQATDGNFYGSVSAAFGSDPSSTNFGPGAYFQLTPAGVYTVIYKFPIGGTGPSQPFGNLTEVTPGVFFGTAGGGSAGDGTLIKLTTSPTIVSSTASNATIGVSYNYGIRTNQTVTSYSATGLPPGLTFSTSTGAISGKPTTAGTYNVALKATNAAGTGSATLKITVTAPKPVITSALTATATQGTTFSYTITASNSPTSYGASGLPAGLSVSTSTGKITGKPTAAPGTFSVTIAAFNGAGAGSAKLTLTLKGAPPMVTSATTGTATLGSAYSYQIVATNSPTKYGASGLPAGLTLNQTTGKISGTPTKAGSFVVTIAAFNATGSGSAKLTLTVKAATKPVITSSLNPPSRQGVAFSYQITATNSPTSYGASGLPAGLSIVQSTGKISGTPTVNGTFSVTIAAFNAAGAGTAKLSLVVKPPL